MIDSKVPWGLTAGNHDEEADLNSSEGLEVDISYRPWSMTLENSETLEHNFNYILPIYSSNSDSSEITSRLWFLGTGRENCLGVYGYDCIMPD